MYTASKFSYQVYEDTIRDNHSMRVVFHDVSRDMDFLTSNVAINDNVKRFTRLLNEEYFQYHTDMELWLKVENRILV